ncbi:MAG: hypothetical protein NC452_02140 [Eubacterium sp.]|nr:hypothetical protein [Eubacterium sp.]
MSTKIKVKVWIDFKNGGINCICHRAKKKCRKQCSREVVELDRYYGLQETFYTDKYGKSKIK